MEISDLKYVPVQALERFGSDNFVRMAGKEAIFKCPYCSERRGTPDSTGHLYVDTKNLVYFCFRCEVKGFLGEGDSKGYDFTPIPTDPELMEAIGEVINRNSVSRELYSLEYSKPLIDSTGTPYEMEAIDYLIRRGFDMSVISYYGIRLGSKYSKQRNRVIIPNEIVHGEDGIDYTDMYVARAFGDVGTDRYGNPFPKYMNPFGNNRRESVFNLHRVPEGVPIIITEGCITSISAGRNAVATYGKYVTDIQLRKILSNRPSMIYVALDPDALSTAEELCKRISAVSCIPVNLVILPEGEDANSLGHVEFMKYVAESKRWNPVARNIEKLLGNSLVLKA